MAQTELLRHVRVLATSAIGGGGGQSDCWIGLRKKGGACSSVQERIGTLKPIGLAL